MPDEDLQSLAELGQLSARLQDLGSALDGVAGSLVHARDVLCDLADSSHGLGDTCRNGFDSRGGLSNVASDLLGKSAHLVTA